MITFTSETAGQPNGDETPRSCPRCERATALQVSLRTEYVVFYRCPECGHIWIVKPAPKSA